MVNVSFKGGCSYIVGGSSPNCGIFALKTGLQLLPLASSTLCLLADSSKNFAKYCIRGLKADKKRISQLLENSLMLVTALAPKIGYDNASKIPKKAHKNGSTLREEAIKSGLINEKEFSKLADPKKMIGPK